MSPDKTSALHIRAVSRLPEQWWPGVMAAPWRYDLFQLLRRIDAQGGEPYLLGRAPLPRYESLRIGQEPSMAFAPATISKVKSRSGTRRYEISILNFGLFGPNGALPVHLTEYARERLLHFQDTSFSAFADLFHHRLSLLFYRAWADAQPTVSLDRPDDQRFKHYLSCLIGMGQPAQLSADELCTHARLMMAGHLTRQAKGAEGLQKILQHYFSVPVTLHQNVPHWLPLSSREQARLGSGRFVPRLGQSTFLGVAVRDVQHKFRIEIGPLDLTTYHQFLPGERLSRELCAWVRQYMGIEYAWDLRLTLKAEDAKGLTLGNTCKLGLSSWLGIQPHSHPRNDLIFTPECHPSS